MSQDEIVFGEVSYREPRKLRRPDRDRAWACVSYELPGPNDLPIFLDSRTADAIERHALRDTSVELGGILLGKECLDDQTGTPFVWVTQSLEAKHYENTQASFTYTHDSWEEITRERDAKHPDLDVVGWYHTHPDFGVFLSSHDLFIQHHFFAQPLQVAYVVDPIRQTRGFFQWRDGRMEEVDGFFLTAQRTDRVALARLANDLENLPGASDQSGGGGALSPRLEAELIAMLSRPSVHYAAPPASQAQSAVLFAILGAMLGVMGMAALLWLNQLSTRIADQTAQLAELKKAMDTTADRDRITLDAAVGDGGGGEGPKRFLERYGRLAGERDKARAELQGQIAANEILGATAKKQAADVAALRKDLADATLRAQTNEADAKETNTLRKTLETLSADLEVKKKQVDQLELLADSPDGQKALAFLSRYNMTWYTAVGGWSLSAVLALALVAGYNMNRPSDGEPPTGTSSSQDSPTHRIV